jgi:outer membrane protein
MKSILSIALVCTLSYSQMLTLDDLIESAIINSPDIKISKADYQASKQQSLQADADYLPQVNLAAEAGKQGVEFGAQSNGIALSNDSNLLLASVNAKQLIYDFGKTGGNMESFENQSYAFKASLQQKISDKIYAVKKAYYALLSDHALIDVNTENIELNAQQLNRSERYFEAGIRTKVDVTDARVNLIDAQLGLQNTKYDMSLSLVNLKKEVGMDNESERYNIEIFIQKPQTDDIYASLPKLPLPVAQYKEEAYKNRAELDQYIQLLKAAQSAYKQVDGDYYPSIYAEVDYLVQETDNFPFAPDEQWKAGIALEWNLYAGNKTDALNEEARIIIMRAQADLENARLRIQKEVNDAYILVNKQLDNTRLSQSLSVASKEKFSQVQKRYEYGLADYVELQQARQSYIDSRARLMQSYYGYYTAMAALERAVGK